KDAGLMFFDIAPLKYDSWAEYAKGVQAILDQHQSIKLTRNNDTKIHRAGNTVWATSTIAAELVMKADGKRMTPTLRWTVIFEKRGKDWLIVHEHVSMPQE